MKTVSSLYGDSGVFFFFTNRLQYHSNSSSECELFSKEQSQQHVQLFSTVIYNSRLMVSSSCPWNIIHCYFTSGKKKKIGKTVFLYHVQYFLHILLSTRLLSLPKILNWAEILTKYFVMKEILRGFFFVHFINIKFFVVFFFNGPAILDEFCTLINNNLLRHASEKAVLNIMWVSVSFLCKTL